MYQIPSSFKDFIAPDCERAAFIQNCLKAAGLEAPILQMEGKNHIYVKFPQSQYNPIFRIKTVIAHYDRFPGSPGANDNSAAVFALMEWAAQLARFAQNTVVEPVETTADFDLSHPSSAFKGGKVYSISKRR